MNELTLIDPDDTDRDSDHEPWPLSGVRPAGGDPSGRGPALVAVALVAAAVTVIALFIGTPAPDPAPPHRYEQAATPANLAGSVVFRSSFGMEAPLRRVPALYGLEGPAPRVPALYGLEGLTPPTGR